ncbi:MAG TPA: hypothetical protein VGD94_00555 [Vicinamibacterales bacterium]
MSYLSRPVFHFMGGVYANPSTANNQDFADVFSVDTLTFNPTMTPIPGAQVQYPAGQQTLPYGGAADSAQARAWLMGLMTGLPASEGGPYGQQAHWNYYGDHATRFESATVNTIWARPGVTVPTTDPLYGATVQIVGNVFFGGPPSNAVMVDVDPLALITTQIFSAGFRVIAADGKTVLIDAQQNNRAFSYFINPYKNVDPNAIGFQMVSAIFIGSVQNGPGLRINPSGVTSPALDDLAAAAAAGAGLNIRYCFYDAIYQTTPEELYADYAKGVYSPNPYVGKMLGTIGVLQPGDMLSAPPGRKLYVQKEFSTAGATCGGQEVTASTIALGEALANVDTTNALVTLDAISTFPECNVNTNEKLSLGPLNLVVVPASGGTPITIGSIPNDQQTYESGGGLVEISYASSPNLAQIQQNIATGTLAIQGLSPATVLLAEVPDIDIQTDDRAVYFQEAIPQPGGPPQPGTATMTIKVFRKGVLAQTPTTVILEHWMCQKDYINPDKPMVPVPLPGTPPDSTGPYFSVAGATALPNTSYFLRYYGGGPQTVPAMTESVVVPAGGVLTLTLTAIRPGTSAIRFRDANVPPAAPNFAWDNEFYALVRILPTDDYSSYTDEQINNWPFIYSEVFCYFSLLYPIMSTFIPWGPHDAPQDPEKVKAFANNMIQFTDPNFWNSTLYMPITRELSAGKRALLVRWCNLNM